MQYKDLLFSRKYLNIATRFMEVDKRYKKDFFKKIKNDLLIKDSEVKSTIDLDCVKPKARHIYLSAVNSDDYHQFESSLNSFRR